MADPKHIQSFLNAFQVLALRHNLGEMRVALHWLRLWIDGGPAQRHALAPAFQTHWMQLIQEFGQGLQWPEDLRPQSLPDQRSHPNASRAAIQTSHEWYLASHQESRIPLTWIVSIEPVKNMAAFRNASTGVVEYFYQTSDRFVLGGKPDENSQAAMVLLQKRVDGHVMKTVDLRKTSLVKGPMR